MRHFTSNGTEQCQNGLSNLSLSMENEQADDAGQETQRLLRGEELAAGRAVWVPPTPFDDGYDVCGPKAKYKSWEGKRAYHCSCASSTCRRHTTQSTANFFGRCSLASEHHRR